MEQKVLLIEDDTGSRLAIVSSLSQKGYAVSVASNLSHAEEDVLARRFDAVILGINLGDGVGSGFIKAIRAYDLYLPIIVVTGSDEIEIAVDAVRCGADQVLAKPIEFAALSASLRTLLEHGNPRQQPADRQAEKGGEETFFATSPAARRFLDSAAKAAGGNAPVLITGETGTGKGVLARWMHRNGGRSALPMTAVYCSGLREDLLEAELFGVGCELSRGEDPCEPGLLQKGAGTLIVDEIGDMDLTVQAGLLAALQARAARPEVNGAAAGTGFQLICTSNRQLGLLARTGSFLPELLTRISATVLRIPPLRERLAEFPDIVRYLLDGLRGPDARISDAALRLLKGYHWPGNLRELRNALDQGLLISHGATLRPEHFNWLKPTCRAREARPKLTLSERKEQQNRAVLQRASGDHNEEASSPGISRATMHRRLKELRGKSY